jgi:hypothetical protein
MAKKVELYKNVVVKEDGTWFVHIYQELWAVDDKPLLLVVGPFATRTDARQVKNSLDDTLGLIRDLTTLELELGGE